MADQYNPLEVRPVGNNMYSYDNELYDINFPEEWATNHLPHTGPKECANCAYFGSISGTFFAYCANCAQVDYNFTRGPGMWHNYCELYTDKAHSIFDTYMKNIELEDIGDKDLRSENFDEEFAKILKNRKKLQGLVKNPDERDVLLEYIQSECFTWDLYDIDESVM